MIAICLLTKNENQYLQEWIQYHINIGVEHFYIYDNNDHSADIFNILDDFEASYFTVIPWKAYCSHMQVEAYNDCLRRFGEDNEWIAFIDTDEFIRCENIHDTLTQYKQYDYIRIPWIMYNANGQLCYSEKPVRERFKETFEIDLPTDYYKSVVQPNKVGGMIVHDAVSATNNYILADDIKLDHYYTRSLEEWVEKINRGSCSPYSSRKYHEFFIYNPDLIQYKDTYFNCAQKYNDCLKTIDIKIMAHPSRRDNVLKILKQLNMEENIVIYDNREIGGDALYTARKAWLSPLPSDKTHRLVLQDDILLCDNFLNIVSDIINTMKDKVISLFNLVPIEMVKNKQCCYMKYETLSGCAIIMPAIYIQECWRWIDDNSGGRKQDDLLIADYCKKHNIDMFTTIPTIVQHLGDTELQSLLSAKYAGLRYSTTYVQHPTDDFTIYIPEKIKLNKFKDIVRNKRAQKILMQRSN